MTPTALALGTAAFLVTYFVHSTLLLGGAWIWTRRMPARASRRREVVWRTALFGPILTAALQVSVGWEPIGGQWSLGEVRSAAPVATAPARVLVPAGPAPVENAPAAPAQAGFVPAPGPSAGSLPLAPVARPAGEDVAPAFSVPMERWPEGVALLWALGLSFAAAVLGLSRRRLSRTLEGCVELDDGPAREALDRVLERSGSTLDVVLRVGPEVASPMSYGFFEPSIAVPPRALFELSEEELEAMLAHEAGHLHRRDPLVLCAAWLVERLFVFQPLNRLARRELAQLAELAADAWAVRATGSSLSLASCLTRIAGWLVAPQRPLFAAPMVHAGAVGRSQLAVRVERLLEDEPGRESPVPRTLRAACAVVLASLFLVAPAVRAAAVGGGEPASPAQLALGFAGHEGGDADDDLDPLFDAVLAPGGLEQALGALDEAVVELETELEHFRSEFEALGIDERARAAMEEIERRTRALSVRRLRLQALARALTALDASGDGDAPTTEPTNSAGEEARDDA